jgi:hypothetical protein
MQLSLTSKILDFLNIFIIRGIQQKNTPSFLSGHHYWKKSKWVEFESAGYLKLFHWDPFVKTQASLKSLPGFLVLSCLTGAMLFSWLGIVVFSIIGWLISKLFVQLLSPVYIEKT